MQQITSNLESGTLLISQKFDINAATASVDATPYFNSQESEYIISFVNLQNVKKITKFKYDAIGLTDTRLLKSFFRISRDANSWTEWLDLKENLTNFPTVDPKDPLFLDIKWIRSGSSVSGTIRILEYSINGELERNMPDNIGDGFSISISPGETIIWSAPFIYKVFRIDDIEVISSDLNDVDIKYRFSQDNSRTWSNWEIFTKENITTVRINPIRFFQIEYSITNNSNSSKSIQDINLIGDFQNVSKDYFKTNLYGIRECCMSNLTGYFDSNGNFIPSDNSSGSCDTSDTLPQLNSQDKANLYNPYKQNTAMNLLNKLSADAEQIFGHRVVYFCTDPDKKGQDHTMHEYQLYNVVCEGNLQVAVDGNNFPDSQIVMNQFDLSLFESMTVHITKKQFKEIFGPQRRPSKEDFLYFCDVNRMFQVDHAQQFRNFNNLAIYYKLILKKYSQKANVKADTQEIKDKLQQLTKNSTIDDLFGFENEQDKKSIANKPQHAPLSRDPIRLEYFAKIDKGLIENSTTIISKSHYDLSSVNYGEVAVRYKNLSQVLKVSDNIGFQAWFKINNYVTDEIYNLLSYYDSQYSLGYKIEITNDSLNIKLNNDDYSFDLLGYSSDQNLALDEDVWYCIVVNIDQRNRNIGYFIYKRDTDDEDDAANLVNNLLKKVYSGNVDMTTPIEYQLENTSCEILGSDMSITNIRVFTETIPEDYHNKILNQYIIRDDSKYLIFADNATTRIYTLPIFPFN